MSTEHIHSFIYHTIQHLTSIGNNKLKIRTVHSVNNTCVTNNYIVAHQ